MELTEIYKLRQKRNSLEQDIIGMHDKTRNKLDQSINGLKKANEEIYSWLLINYKE